MSRSPVRIDRRTFLAGAAGGLVAVGLARCGGSGGRAQTTETVGGWVQPISRRSVAGQLSTTLRASEGPVLVGTKQVRAIAYEQMYPAPTLVVRPGDVLKVDLVNDAPVPTNLHTHGLHVSPIPPSDNVLFAVAPGHSFHYEYELPANHPAGTYWYHAHYHPLVETQVGAGLFGALIIRGDEDAVSRVAPSGERVMVFSQIDIQNPPGTLLNVPNWKFSDQSTLVNGLYQPSLTIAPNEIQRWRMLNASEMFLRLGLDNGQVLHQMAVDGHTMAEVVPQEVVEIPPGGRTDVLVQLDREGTLNLQSLGYPPNQFGAFASNSPPPQTVVRIVSQGRPLSPRPKLPDKLVPFHSLRHAKIDYRRRFRLQQLAPNGLPQVDTNYLDQYYAYYINGRVFNLHRVDETMVLGDTEEWHFINDTVDRHPIHIHQNPFQVIAVNDQPVSERHYRDTATLPAFGTLTIRHHFLDYTGRFVWHCHVLFHEDHGMMQQLEVVNHGRPHGVEAVALNSNLAAAEHPFVCHLPLV